MKRILISLEYCDDIKIIILNDKKYYLDEINCLDFYNIISANYILNEKPDNFKIVIDSKILPINNEPLDKYIKYIKYKTNDDELDTTNNVNNRHHTFFIDIIGLLKGGDPISDIVGALNAILRVFELLLKGVIFLFKIAVWIVQFTIWFMVEFLNPVYLFSDIIGSVMKITRLCIVGIFDVIFGVVKVVTNKVLGPVFEGNVMGWDQETYRKEKEKRLKEEENKQRREEEIQSRFTNTDRNPDKQKGGKSKDNFSDNSNNSNNSNMSSEKCGDNDKCYQTPPGQIPFSIIIMTIICPPLGIFMQYGLSFWINIILCCLLTMIYYVPGLIYSLILLYC